MSTVKQALQRIANEVPETRQFIVPLLQRHAACACGDEVLASGLDEVFGGRKYDPGPGKQKPYGAPYKTPGMDKGKWEPKQKGKCFYETGDEADRCYTTTNGGPGGPKPDTGPAKNRDEYNRKYRKQRWNQKSAEAKEAHFDRLAELREAASDYYGYVEDSDGNMVRFVGPTSKASVTKLLKSPAVEKVVDDGGSTTSQGASYMKTTLSPHRKKTSWFSKLPATDKRKLDKAIATLFDKSKTAAARITPEMYARMKPGTRVLLGVKGPMISGGPIEFEVGRTSYSKKYDVFSKRLHPLDEEGSAIKRGVAPWTLFQREGGDISLAHSNMGVVMTSFEFVR